ncbi:hypothetical protein OG474_26855 [Kribbella sp. NBC_01505]|uniref:hypothetical protein n=1 Tax=Kribbella sp. NBC_01505 TaxID=2903580 RepID=UPI00386D19A0
MVAALGPLNRRDDVAVGLGIRSEAIERLVSDLTGLENMPYVSSVGANLGYVLGGDFRTWSLPESTPAEIYQQAIRGFEVLRPFMSMERASDAFLAVPAAAANPSANYVMVAIELLRGRREPLAAQLQAAEKVYCRRDDEVCADFRAFEARARARFPQSM